MRKVLYTVTLVLLIAVFAFSGFQVVNYFIESKAQADEFGKLQQMKDNATQATEAPATETAESTGGTTEATEETGPTEPQILPDYSELYKMNNDLAGWITIEGTEIDYPVMHTPENPNFYLKKNFSGDYSAHGCIYAREECDLNEPSDNITIYGHNMMDGSMFAALHKYANKAKWEENSLIIFNTLYEYDLLRVQDRGKYGYRLPVSPVRECDFGRRFQRFHSGMQGSELLRYRHHPGIRRQGHLPVHL